jgi:DNA-directed RNA polymerase subunit RPC12/RpoP
MVHLYACTICKNKIPADDNRIHCSDCGSEICGSCYLRKKTSHFHELDHTNYMMAEASGSMYVRPPAPPMRTAPKANNTKKKAVRVANDLMPFPCSFGA